MLGGLDRPTAGSVTVDGKDIFSLKDEELTIFRRRKIGFVFQSYNLVPVLNVYENIVLPIELDGGEIDGDYVKDVISLLGLKEKLYNLPSQLSGDSSSVWPSPGRLRRSPPLCWRMSQREIWIPGRVRMFWV